jgi:hypothetical protein
MPQEGHFCEVLTEGGELDKLGVRPVKHLKLYGEHFHLLAADWVFKKGADKQVESNFGEDDGVSKSSQGQEPRLPGWAVAEGVWVGASGGMGKLVHWRTEQLGEGSVKVELKP